MRELKTIYGDVIFAIETEKTIAELVSATLAAKKSLGGADLRGADLRVADLCGADLRGADLCVADLCGADLRGADLRVADLRGAALCGADLCGADLRGADLRGAALCGADLRGANNADLAIAQMQFIPEEGAFIGWKKCAGNVLVKLQIPAKAKRSHGSERKCRASHVKVLGLFAPDGTAMTESGVALSLHDGKTEYRKGETVKADSFDENRWDTCSNGIHFYITRLEAEAHA